jgi:hypothetical protein
VQQIKVSSIRKGASFLLIVCLNLEMCEMYEAEPITPSSSRRQAFVRLKLVEI